MNILDDGKYSKQIFKVVRVKNKLGEPAKNAIINYFFLGKIQCELQLSIE